MAQFVSAADCLNVLGAGAIPGFEPGAGRCGRSRSGGGARRQADDESVWLPFGRMHLENGPRQRISRRSPLSWFSSEAPSSRSKRPQSLLRTALSDSGGDFPSCMLTSRVACRLSIFWWGRQEALTSRHITADLTVHFHCLSQVLIFERIFLRISPAESSLSL